MTLALISDLIFESKLRAAAEALNVELRTTRTLAAARALLAEADMLILDLHFEAGDPLELVPEYRAACPAGRVLGFYSHVRHDTRQAALQAGIDEVLPRAAFVTQLARILAPAPDA